LLSLVAELEEEVDRLRNVGESEKERDWWNHALPSLKQKQEHPSEKTQDQGDPVFSPHHAEGNNLKERNQ